MARAETKDTQAAYRTVFREIQELTAAQLKALFIKVLDNSENAYKKIADALRDSQERARLQDTLLNIKNHRSAILKSILRDFNHIFAGDQPLKSKNEEQALNLSLVDDETLEESILLADLANKISETYDMPIRAIRRGIVRISKKLDKEPEPDALTPKQFAQLLQASVVVYQLSLTEKTILYNSFRDCAAMQLKPIYTGALTLLQEYGLIDASENPLSPNFEMIKQFRLGSAQIPPATLIRSKTSAPDPSDETLSGLLDSKQNTMEIHPMLQNPVAANAISQAVFQDSALSRLLYDYLSAPGKKFNADADSSQLSPLESEKLMTLLSSLQNQTDSNDTLTDSSAVSRLINTQLQSSVSNTTAEIPSIESNVIDLINKLFVAILEDPDLPDPVKVQMSRLQIPYIKVALLDITFLKEEAHPARLLLNEISLLGVGVSDSSNPALDKIKHITQSILDNFETDLNIFSQLLQETRDYHKQETARASVAEQETRGKAETQAKLLYIKKLVVQQIRKFLKGKALPKELHTIVTKGFAPLFLKIYRNQGEDSDSWRSAVDLFRQIVESVQARDSLHQLGIIVERAPTILSEARVLLAQVTRRGDDSDLAADLEAYYKHKEAEYLALKKETPQTPAKQDDTRDPFDYGDDIGDLTIEEEIRNQPSMHDIIAQLPEALKPGAWCEVYMGRNNPPRRLKVSFIIEDTAQIVFVDDTGLSSQVKDIAELLDELDCERSKIIQDNNLFDKALAAVISNLQLAKEST